MRKERDNISEKQFLHYEACEILTSLQQSPSLFKLPALLSDDLMQTAHSKYLQNDWLVGASFVTFLTSSSWAVPYYTSLISV